MALTATEEAQLRELIAQQSALLNLATNESTITSKLSATKKNLSSLNPASSLNNADLSFVRQGSVDRNMPLSLLSSYIIGQVPGVADATTTTKGVVELATTAESAAGVDNVRAVTPLGVAQYCPDASTTVRGKIQLATTAEFNAGVDNSKAVTSSMVASKANKGSNFDITSLNGLNASQNWSNVANLEVGANVPTAAGSNYIISYNSSASANSSARLWSRQRNTSNTNWIDAYLDVSNNTNTNLVTTNQYLNVFSGGQSGFRWNNGICEYLPIGGFGGIQRLYGSSTNAWDIYSTNTDTPTLQINNNPGSTGVRLVWGSNTWATLSDETKKTTIKPIPNALGKVNQLRAGTGRYLTDSKDKSRAFVGAQSVQAVLPEAVFQDVDGLVLSETNLIPLLINAIQEMTKRIDELEKA